MRPSRPFERSLFATTLMAATVVAGCSEGCGHGRTSAPADVRDSGASLSGLAVAPAMPRPLAPAMPRPLPPEVDTKAGTSLGLRAFTANARVQPHGHPTTVRFEYGVTTAYGSTTPARPLAPRLAAFYHETWDRGLAGWTGGMSSKDLAHQPAGGVSGGFLRYVDSLGAGDDTNHLGGIGVVHLTQYFYLGSAVPEADMPPSAALGGGDPDLRDARVTIHVRGDKWQANGSELVWWMQCDKDLSKQNEADWRRANWAHTGFSLNESLLSGKWEKVEYRLVNDSSQWTYAGNAVPQTRPNYVYWSLDEALSHVNQDAFHMLAFIDQAAEPTGTIDYDELEIAYRNHSVLLASNGGKLVSSPVGAPDDPALLTDGWRHGPGRSWRSAFAPSSPVELTYELAAPVTIDRVQIHQHAEWPSKDVEVAVSKDGSAWRNVAAVAMPLAPKEGQNFAFALEHPVGAEAVRYVKVRIMSGFRPQHWGLGEIEAFGSGAVMQTDDEWYAVNQDVSGVKPGQTIHYRAVATNAMGTTTGSDLTFVVPSGKGPEVTTGVASRLRDKTARLSGRVNALGKMTEAWFEYGPTKEYGTRTPVKESPREVGLQITPRDVHAILEDLVPGATLHFRLVAKNATGTTFGDDASFTAK